MDAAEKALEQELYRVPGVVAVRFATHRPDQRAQISVLVRADVAVDAVSGAILAAVERCPLPGRTAGLRIVPLGEPESMIELTTGEQVPVVETVPPPERVQLVGVIGITEGTSFTAEVALRASDMVHGRATGVVASGSDLRIVGAATLGALVQLDPALEAGYLEVAEVVALGGRTFVAASVVLAGLSGEELLAGIAPVRAGGAMDAAARAVLAALNRRLEGRMRRNPTSATPTAMTRSPNESS